MTLDASPKPRRGPERGALAGAGRCGRYELLGSAGRGGKAWIARRRGAAEPCVLRLAECTGGESLARAQAAAAVRHPGLVEILDWGVEEHAETLCVFTAERRYAGGSLTDLLESLHGRALQTARPRGRDRLPGSGSFEARAAALGSRVAEALAALHAAGIAHGALGPDSILLDGAGGVRLRAPALETAQGDVLPPRGAPTWPLAPERVRGAAPTPASDLFELGATLYTLLVLRAPFRGTGPEIARNAREAEPPRPTRVQPYLLPAADAVLLQALQKNPARRPSSAAALAADLRALSRGAPVAAPPPTVWARAFGELRARRASIAHAVLLACFGAAGGLKRHA